MTNGTGPMLTYGIDGHQEQGKRISRSSGCKAVRPRYKGLLPCSNRRGRQARHDKSYCTLYNTRKYRIGFLVSYVYIRNLLCLMPRRYEERIRDQASYHDTNTIYGQSQAQSSQQLFLPLALPELFDCCVFFITLNVRFSPEVHIIIVGLL